MTERASELIAASADSGFTDADAVELLELAKSDPAVAQELAEHFELHRALELAVERESTDERESRVRAVLYYIQVSAEQTRFFKRVEAKIKARPSNRQRRSFIPRRLRWFGFLAASVALAAGAYILVFGAKPAQEVASPSKPPAEVPERTVASITKLEGSAELTRNGTRGAIHAGLAVLENDELTTLKDGKLELQYSDGTAIALNPETHATFESDSAHGKHITLDRGALMAQVSKQPENAPLQIVTPHAEVRVLGTEFRLAVTARDSQLDLKTGTVRVTQLDTHRSIELHAGNTLHIAPQKEMSVAPLAPLASLAPEPFAIDDFETGALDTWLLSWPPKSKSKITHSLVAGKNGKFAMHVDYSAPHGDWAWTVCEKFMDHPQDWSAYAGVQFWFKGTNSGNTIMCEVFDNGFPGAPRYVLERFRFQFYDTQAGWRLLRLPFERFYRDESNAGANIPNDGFDRKQVHAIGFVVNDVTGSFDVDDISLYRDAGTKH